jgi:hypothetical protein
MLRGQARYVFSSTFSILQAMAPSPPDIEAQKLIVTVSEHVSEDGQDINQLVQPVSRLLVEYRTLSDHIESHTTPDANVKGKDADKRKRAVKGAS